MLKSLSPIDVALIKKIGGNGSSYTLPIASATKLGGVQPVAKTDAMTQSVGVDESGALWAPPGSGGGNSWEHIIDFTLAEDVSELFVMQDSTGNMFEYDELFAQILFTASANNTSENSVELRFIFDKNKNKRTTPLELPYGQRTKGTILHTVSCVLVPYTENAIGGIMASYSNGKLGSFSSTSKKLSGIRLWPYTQYIAAGTFISMYGRNRT